MRKILCIFFLLGFLNSCSNTSVGDIIISDAPIQTICKIKDKGLGHLNSLCVLNDDLFVISHDSRVDAYGGDGELKYQIGSCGRAKYEYYGPMNVRANDDNIIVWSSRTLKFIVYSRDGSPLEESYYPSAVVDFIPLSKGRVAVYSCGLRDSTVIDVYDLKSEASICPLYASSFTHRLLNHSVMSAPLYYDGNALYFMPRDKLDIIRYNERLTQNSDCFQEYFESPSFCVDKNVKANTNLSRKGLSNYLNNNSSVVSLFKKEDCFYILTSEGHRKMKDGSVDKSEAFYSLYRVQKGRLKRVISFHAEPISDYALITTYGGNIYFIHHDIVNEDDVYSLNKLDLSNF